ncbi:E3 UFM1-protein ligase 1 isoform X2 [Anolis carolinensis]|uniref:E3 UFM1-protein ligase 1 isoform X2 n=1 Tax=Anolis carolinensis TaxID=28377 RepID=UPI000462533F|nr:PREDICTED: E3 UFM1-protein ligase 1 isoform X4 [Anolis carolinensis]|eukprot:XP_008115837.1 PREDICTED: E3 UFM1-protein ligase 1 isoform X4 [Anolis carolinensis]
MEATWEEILQLSQQFQSAQFAQATQRLSERNCIEIVSKLIAEKQLEVVHTLDGKEYITPAQIIKEIRDELHVRGGRVNIVDLQQAVNVDLVHIENRAHDIVKSDRTVQLVLGQLVDERYLDQIAEETNDKLQESGQVKISDLCKAYDLPGDFLKQAFSIRLGKIIHGQIDQDNRGVIFTEAFVTRHRARIRGLFRAITRPTPIINLITRHGFQEHLLYSMLEELVNTGHLKGTVVGGRQDKAVFIPDIYAKTQSNWVDSFFKQNGYLEFDALSRLGIPDPMNYIKKRYKSLPLLFLKASCVGQEMVDQVEASVDEAISSGTWVDIAPLLPSSLSVEDASMLLQQVMRAFTKQPPTLILGDTNVVSEKFLNSCADLFIDLMHQKAEKEMKNNPVHLITEEDLKQSALLENASSSKKDKKDERRKKATEGTGSVRGGSGGNAREYKIKKTKKKGRKDVDSDEESQASRSKHLEIPFMSQEEIEEVLRKHVKDCPDDLITELADHLIRPLTKRYQEELRSVFMSSTSTSSGASRRKTIKDLQEEVSNLYNNIRLFEKGARHFTDETQTNIAKHMLKTVCTDITNLIFNFLAADLMMAAEDYTAITSEMRKKILSTLPEETRGPLTKLHISLNGKSVEEFVTCLDVAADACDIMAKRGDKKKERQILFQHRQALIEHLKVTEDPALVLHLTSVLLFQFTTHCMLHAPGRCVPQIITFLSTKIPEDQHSLLIKYQGLVVKQLISQNKKIGQGDDDSVDNNLDTEENIEAIRKELQELSASVKDLVLRPRKTSVTEE